MTTMVGESSGKRQGRQTSFRRGMRQQKQQQQQNEGMDHAFSIPPDQDAVETFPGAVNAQDSRLLRHGRLYVFNRHLAFDAQLPFGLQTTAVIPLRDVNTATKGLRRGMRTGLRAGWQKTGKPVVAQLVRLPSLRDEAADLISSLWPRGQASTGDDEQGAPVSSEDFNASELGFEKLTPSEVVPAEEQRSAPGAGAGETGTNAVQPEWEVVAGLAPEPPKEAPVVWEGDLPYSVRAFCELLLNNDNTVLNAYHKRRENRNVEISAWQPQEGLGEVRVANFVSPVSAPFSPPETHVHETHHCRLYEGGRHLVVELSASAKDVPFGDAFSMETRFDVTQIEGGWSSFEGRCHVVVRLQAVFSKKTVWKRLIAQSVQAAGGRAMAELMQLAKQVAAAPATPQPQPPSAATGSDDDGHLAEPPSEPQAVASGVPEGSEWAEAPSAGPPELSDRVRDAQDAAQQPATRQTGGIPLALLVVAVVVSCTAVAWTWLAVWWA